MLNLYVVIRAGLFSVMQLACTLYKDTTISVFNILVVCRWITEVDENEATYEEQKLFVKTDHVKNLVSCSTTGSLVQVGLIGCN